MRVRDKVCVVTGAASGIGEAVARAYAEAGARGMVVADLKSSRDQLASVAADIDGLAVTADVAQEAEVQSLIIAAEARFGPVDVFFSNAGRGSQKPARHLPRLLSGVRRLLTCSLRGDRRRRSSRHSRAGASGRRLWPGCFEGN